MTHTFPTSIYLEEDDIDAIPVEVHYTVRDTGVMGSLDARSEAVLLDILILGEDGSPPVHIMDLLEDDEDLMEDLRAQAMSRWVDAGDRARFGDV